MIKLRDFVAISDIHYNLQNVDPASAVLKQALNEARRLGVPLFIGGDLNDTKAVLRAESVQSLIHIFGLYSDVTVVIVIGNHDLINHNGQRHSLDFLKLLKNVTVIDEPAIVGEWGVIPYIHNKERFLQELKGMATCKVKKLLIHQGVQGALMSEYAFDDSSVTLEDFKDFDLILSGHYHRWQWVGEKFMYFGSPFTTRFDEADQKKYIHHVFFAGADTVKIDHIETKVRRHVQIEFENKITPIDKLPPDSLVKVILRGERAFVTSITKDQMRELLGVENVTIVPSITKQMSYRMNVDSGSKPQDVIFSYPDKAETQFDKTKLKDYIAKML